MMMGKQMSSFLRYLFGGGETMVNVFVSIGMVLLSWCIRIYTSVFDHKAVVVLVTFWVHFVVSYIAVDSIARGTRGLIPIVFYVGNSTVAVQLRRTRRKRVLARNSVQYN